jgi:hypothetical protein
MVTRKEKKPFTLCCSKVVFGKEEEICSIGNYHILSKNEINVGQGEVSCEKRKASSCVKRAGKSFM